MCTRPLAPAAVVTDASYTSLEQMICRSLPGADITGGETDIKVTSDTMWLGRCTDGRRCGKSLFPGSLSVLPSILGRFLPTRPSRFFPDEGLNGGILPVLKGAPQACYSTKTSH